MACKTTQRVSAPNVKLFGPMKNEEGEEVGEFSIVLYGKWAGGHSFAYKHGCHIITGRMEIN